MSPELTLWLTGTLLAALMLLGLSLQLGWRRQVTRWLHHALFFAVCAGLLLTLLLAWPSGRRWWALLPALVLLLTMPATKPGRADHWQRALACAVALAVGAWAL